MKHVDVDCVSLVCYAFQKYIYNNQDSKYGIFVLESDSFAITRSINSKFNNLIIQLAQDDGWTFDKMNKNLEWLNSNTKNKIELHYNEYKNVIPKIGKVHLDYACIYSGWVKNKHIIETRFQKQYYASSSLLVLTISRQEQHDQCILQDLYAMAINNNYVIKPLTISQLDPDYSCPNFKEFVNECICFSYESTYTFIMYIHSV
jgi:hypothetical protein